MAWEHATEPRVLRVIPLAALAAAYALQGNSEAALEHLKAAIQLRPGNAYQARHDEDFQSLASHPVFRSLVRADVSASATIP